MPSRGAAVGEPAHGLPELPHDVRVLRRAEVEAVGDGDRHGAAGRHVAVRLGQRELRADVGVERDEAGVAVGGDGHPATGRLVDPDHPGVGGLRADGVAAHVAVVLVGDPGAAGEVGARGHPEDLRPQLGRGGRAGQGVREVGDQRVLPLRAGHRAPVHRAVVGDRARRHVDHGLVIPGDHQPVAVGDLADHGGEHVPPLADRQELRDVVGPHDRAHPLLRLAGEDLRGRHAGGPERNGGEVDAHAAVARAGQLGGGAGQARPAEVLDADDQARLDQLEAALDEHLLRERVADLHGRELLACRLLGRRRRRRSRWPARRRRRCRRARCARRTG